jgi:hypothetical protein
MKKLESVAPLEQYPIIACFQTEAKASSDVVFDPDRAEFFRVLVDLILRVSKCSTQSAIGTGSALGRNKITV